MAIQYEQVLIQSHNIAIHIATVFTLHKCIADLKKFLHIIKYR